MAKQEEKKVEELLREERKRLAGYFVTLLVFVGLAGLIVGYYFAPKQSSPLCDQLILVPPGASLPKDVNVHACYQEVNGLPGYVSLCPTRVGVAFALLPELNRDTVWQSYQNCLSYRQSLEVNLGVEVNGS